MNQVRRIDRINALEWVVKDMEYRTATHVCKIEDKLEVLRIVINQLLAERNNENPEDESLA